MNDPTGGQGAGPGPGDAGAEPSEEELRLALEEQMRNITVQDVLVQTVVTLVNLAARRLGLTAQPGEEPPDRDLEQARIAIEAVKALIPLSPQEGMDQIKQALSQLQIAYAKEAQAGGAGVQAPAPGADAPPAPAAPGPQEGAEASKPPSKLWTPRGT